MEGFLESLGEAWARTEQRFLKLECWQSYLEADGVRSQEAFQAGDVALARHLLEEEAMEDEPLRDEVRSRNLKFTRVRLLSYPLTDYLHYEMINYEVRSRLAERIEFFVPPSPVSSYFDFLCSTPTPPSSTTTGPGPSATRPAAGSPTPQRHCTPWRRSSPTCASTASRRGRWTESRIDPALNLAVPSQTA
ncbi:DUF6879 family protein [Spirillospora sp. CA-108201]